jgi:predicted esterase
VELPGKPSTLPLSFQKTPVFLGHGKKDLEVDIQHGRQACELLQKMDVSVQLQVYPQLGHELSSIMIDSAAAFIRNLI